MVKRQGLLLSDSSCEVFHTDFGLPDSARLPGWASLSGAEKRWYNRAYYL